MATALAHCDADGRAVPPQRSALHLPPLRAGDTVGPYRVAEKLGEGGTAVVYRVEHIHLRKQVALKVLRRELMHAGLEAVVRFFDEARLSAQPQSRDVIDVYDIGTLPDGRPVLIMELLLGDSLAELIDAQGAFDPARSIAIAEGAARALSAVHRSGVIHRDITPGNIFIESPGAGERVKLVDFGSARLREVVANDQIVAPEATVVGTPWYMSPEQVRGLACDERSDLYSLGIVLYELLTGDTPFDGHRARDIAVQHVKSPVPPPTSPRGRLPRRAVSTVLRLLAKDAAQRYQTADQLLPDLVRARRAVESRTLGRITSLIG